MDTIPKLFLQAMQQAVTLQGPDILKDKNRLFSLLEDLVPTHDYEMRMFQKNYNEGLGEFLCRLFQTEESGKKMQTRTDAEFYLHEAARDMESWGYQLIHALGSKPPLKTIEVKSYAEYKPALSKLLRKYGEIMSLDIVSCFVEENHLFTRYNVDETKVIEDMYKVAKDEKLPWNF